ncbi:hypothetical protein ACSAZL_01135 [Methanosarcina sp. T3]|uniref:hypothetical protein n=1 Tax=Methanosarcina sp. T3 TaxID=3439062 RepID=UPI003F879F14
MGALIDSKDRKSIREEKRLGFPYPVKKRKQKHNLIGEIPINTLNDADYQSMVNHAPEELKKQFDRTSPLTYYDIRDVYFIKQHMPKKSAGAGSVRYAFLFGDYGIEFAECCNIEEAKKTAIKLAIKRNEPLSRVYSGSPKGRKWKRVRGIA